MRISVTENKLINYQRLSNIPTDRNSFEITFKLMRNINVSY